MSKTITSILKEAAGEALSDDTLNAIEELFNAAVDEKSTLATEAALIAQDQKHASKLQAVMEAVDKDRAVKLEKVVKVVTENHTNKLKAVINRYETQLNAEAKTFKDEIIDSIGTHVDNYIEDLIPLDQIQEAVHNKRAITVVNQLREALAVDFALAQDSIRGAVMDGKTRLDESTQETNLLKEENEKLTRELIKARSEQLLEEKTKGLPTEKKNYIKKVLTGKSKSYINENFDYTLRLFDFEETRKKNVLKEEALNSRKGKDADVVVENVQTTPAPRENGNQNSHNTFDSLYMDELTKY